MAMGGTVSLEESKGQDEISVCLQGIILSPLEIPHVPGGWYPFPASRTSPRASHSDPGYTGCIVSPSPQLYPYLPAGICIQPGTHL